MSPVSGSARGMQIVQIEVVVACFRGAGIALSQKPGPAVESSLVYGCWRLGISPGMLSGNL
jgi:hypothetical protein